MNLNHGSPIRHTIDRARNACGREIVREIVRGAVREVVHTGAHGMRYPPSPFTPPEIPHMIATLPAAHHRRANRGAVRIEPPPKGTIKQAVTIARPRADVMRAWRDMSMPDDAIFLDAPAGLGTEVVLEVPHAAPESAFGSAFTTLMKQNPADAAAIALRQLKERLETGEIATTEGQPSGRDE